MPARLSGKAEELADAAGRLEADHERDADEPHHEPDGLALPVEPDFAGKARTVAAGLCSRWGTSCPLLRSFRRNPSP